MSWVGRTFSEGEATINGIKFRLERGDITFANPVAIEPQVNLQATTHVRNYDLDGTVTGTPDRLSGELPVRAATAEI